MYRCRSRTYDSQRGPQQKENGLGSQIHQASCDASMRFIEHSLQVQSRYLGHRVCSTLCIRTGRSRHALSHRCLRKGADH